jgi:glyceraldehyde 3-phosphate dehydrogenase
MAFSCTTTDVSAVDLTVKVAKETSYEDYGCLKNASRNYNEGILGFTEDLVVSQDFLLVIQERLLLTLTELV